MRPRLVMMSGTSPGTGKSTLADALTRRLRAHGAAVDLFGEEQLFIRDEFSEVADGFRTKEFAGPDRFLAAYAATITGIRSAGAWGIFDWACSGMAADLPWAMRDPDLLVRHCRSVRELATDLDPVLLDTVVDIRTAVERAYAQRGKPFADHYLCAAAEAGHTSGSTIDRIVRWNEEQNGALRTVELSAMREAGWPIVTLDSSKPPERVLADAWSALGL